MHVNTVNEIGEVTFSGTANTFQRESEKTKSGETGGNGGNTFPMGSQSVAHLE